MYEHPGLHRIPVPAGLNGRGARHASDTTQEPSSAIGFGAAIGSVTAAMVVGAAVITAAPHTVTVPIAAVLASGVVASALVAAGRRWRAVRRHNG